MGLKEYDWTMNTRHMGKGMVQNLACDQVLTSFSTYGIVGQFYVFYSNMLLNKKYADGILFTPTCFVDPERRTLLEFNKTPSRFGMVQEESLVDFSLVERCRRCTFFFPLSNR